MCHDRLRVEGFLGVGLHDCGVRLHLARQETALPRPHPIQISGAVLVEKADAASCHGDLSHHIAAARYRRVFCRCLHTDIGQPQRILLIVRNGFGEPLVELQQHTWKIMISRVDKWRVNNLQTYCDGAPLNPPGIISTLSPSTLLLLKWRLLSFGLECSDA